MIETLDATFGFDLGFGIGRDERRRERGGYFGLG